jgi:hypothetical protein
MKRSAFVLLVSLLLAVPAARATDVGVDLHIRLGDPAPAPVVIAEPPVFLYPPGLGVYAAVGVPYDLYFLDDRYYCHRHGVWYVAPHYGGPWYYVRPGHLPPGLLKHKYPRVIELRDDEYRLYRKQGSAYHGKTFRPKKGKPPEHKGGHGKGGGKGK